MAAGVNLRSFYSLGGALRPANIIVLYRIEFTAWCRPSRRPKGSRVASRNVKSCRDDAKPPRPLARQHLDLAVDSGDDLELALVGAAFVARNGAVVALGKDDSRKHTGRFFDHVAAGRDH